MYGLLFAFLSPILYAVMNVLDKYIVVHKTRSAMSYTAVVGLANLLIALAVAPFLDWSGITMRMLLFPALAGILLGGQAFFYLRMLEKEDVSHIIGFAYLYPITVAVLSYIFLKEVIPPIGYVGMLLIILGAVLLSSRMREVRFAGAWALIILILLIGLDEFFIKVGTGEIGEWQGVIVNQVAMGLTLLSGILHPAVRRGLGVELPTLRWAFLSEAFTFLSVLTIYLAMAQLPATIVSSIAAIQPLALVLLERAAHHYVGGMTKDDLLIPKLRAILLIVAGVVLLALAA